jgi:hypothetical protein
VPALARQLALAGDRKSLSVFPTGFDWVTSVIHILCGRGCETLGTGSGRSLAEHRLFEVGPVPVPIIHSVGSPALKMTIWEKIMVKMKKGEQKPAKKRRQENKAKKPVRMRQPPPAKEIPFGATREAFDRPLHAGGGAPGSGAGPRHAAGDIGSDIETTGAVDTEQVAGAPVPEIQEILEQGPPYAGVSGGAVGGTPAQKRSSGGRVHR